VLQRLRKRRGRPTVVLLAGDRQIRRRSTYVARHWICSGRQRHGRGLRDGSLRERKGTEAPRLWSPAHRRLSPDLSTGMVTVNSDSVPASARAASAARHPPTAPDAGGDWSLRLTGPEAEAVMTAYRSAERAGQPPEACFRAATEAWQRAAPAVADQVSTETAVTLILNAGW
jgi:hypothetical protein